MDEKELLLTSILNCSRTGLYTRDLPLNSQQEKRLADALSLRSQGYPLQYILGECEFFGLRFKVDGRALIPRPETEILVETAVKAVIGYRLSVIGKIRILDIGTGSGCIAVSLAKSLPGAGLIAMDVSYEALTLAAENVVLNEVCGRINLAQADLFSSLPYKSGVFDVIVSNPPYVPCGQIARLQREISYEPTLALDAGVDGLDFYRAIAARASGFLKKNGLIVLEIGFEQAPAVKNIFQNSGNFEIIDTVKDYSGIDRIIVARSK